MMKPINPVVHGVIDYMASAFLLLAPSIFGLVGVPATILYVIGTLQLLMSLMTAYPLGLFKTIPFTVHAGIEASAAVFMIIAPWLFGFNMVPVIRNLYVLSGLAVVAVWSLTDYYNMYKSGMGTTERFTEYRTDRDIRKAA